MNNVGRQSTRVGMSILALSLIAAACGGSSDGAAETTASQQPTTTAQETTTTQPPTTKAPTTEAPADASAQADYAVLVRGSLVSADMTEAQQLHDAVAGGGQAIAQEAGDVSHVALLGSPLLGSTENAFLALDQWTSVEGLSAFYANPDVAAGFASLFSEPPASEVFERRYDWHQWGGLDNGDSFIWVVVRGHLGAADDDAARIAHDQVASGGQAPALAAGDIAHVVFTGIEDPAEFLAIDVWSDATNLEAFYANPDFADAFATLFDSPPTVAVYKSTDWAQW